MLIFSRLSSPALSACHLSPFLGSSLPNEQKSTCHQFENGCAKREDVGFCEVRHVPELVHLLEKFWSHVSRISFDDFFAGDSVAEPWEPKVSQLVLLGVGAQNVFWVNRTYQAWCLGERSALSGASSEHSKCGQVVVWSSLRWPEAAPCWSGPWCCLDNTRSSVKFSYHKM